jgi:hypothetical protein
VLLDAKLPSVYIRYERQSQEGVWLKLHNNTSGAISLCTKSAYIGPKTAPLKLANGKGTLALKDGVEASVCYIVEAPERKDAQAARGALDVDQRNPYHELPLTEMGHVVSTSWIPAGGSILLSLPREHLADDYQWSCDAFDLLL